MAFGSLGTVAYSVTANDETASGLNSASDRFRKIGTIAGTAMTGIGAGLTMMTDKARQMNAPLEAMAIQLGVNSKELRELAIETANVTFPLDQAISSMDLLVRAGMRDTVAIAATATAFDVLGDATGASASQITTMMIPAFNAFGLELENAANYTDLFTHMQRNTTVEMADFAGMFKYIAPDIDAMGISLKQSIAVMEALAAKGIQGTSATKEFRTAVTQADGDLIQFYEALGLTEAEVGVYITQLEGAKGITNEYADAMNTQYGFMDKLKHSVSELTLKYGSMMQPVEALGPSMAALGPILIITSHMQWANVVATLAHTKAIIGLIPTYAFFGGALTVATIQLKLAAAAQWLMNTSLYACPLVWIVGAIAGVVAVLFVLEKKFGVVTTAVRLLSDGINTIIDFFGGVVDAIRGVVVDTDALVEADGRLIEANERLRESEERVDEVEERAAESAEDLAEASAELAKAQLEVADSAREVDELTEAYEELKSAVDAAAGKTEDLSDLDRNLRSAKLDLADAQDKYQETLSDTEASSRDVERAAIGIERAEDRLDDLQKKRIKTVEELEVAATEAARVQKEQGYESVSSVKAILDTSVAAYKEKSFKVEEAAKHEAEMRKIHEYNTEDVERELLVYGNLLNKIEEIAGEKEKILEGEVDATQSAMGRMKAIVESHWSDMLSIITPGGLFSAGQKAIDGFISGIKSRSGDVGSAVDTSFKEAEDKMPHSDAKEGPFSELTKSGESVVETFSKGIETGSGKIAKSFDAGIAPIAPAPSVAPAAPMAAGSAGGGGGGSTTYGGDTISIGNVSLSRDYDFPALMKDIEVYQSQKRVQRGIRTL